MKKKIKKEKIIKIIKMKNQEILIQKKIKITFK